MPQAGGNPLATWLEAWMQAHEVPLWGAADLNGFATPADADGQGVTSAPAFALPMDRAVMAGIQTGPNQAYADLYAAVNARINEISTALAAVLRQRGIRALALAASKRTDQVNIRGDFPHKTAATRADIGWIGHNCGICSAVCPHGVKNLRRAQGI